MERAALLADHDEVGTAALPFGAAAPAGEDISRMTLDEAEGFLVRRSLEAHNGNLRRSAEALGVTRQALYRRLEKHGLRATAGHD